LQDWITPLIGAIFKGANFWDLSFELNGSTFRYGHFINELIVFMLVCLILYFGVVLPLNKVRTAGGNCSTSASSMALASAVP
jgi:large conductance mechanosensitive channel